jgi:hypothetical protein
MPNLLAPWIIWLLSTPPFIALISFPDCISCDSNLQVSASRHVLVVTNTLEETILRLLYMNMNNMEYSIT